MVATPFGVVRRAEKKHHWRMLGYTRLHVDSTWTIFCALGVDISNYCIVSVWQSLWAYLLVSPASIQRALSGENENMQSWCRVAKTSINLQPLGWNNLEPEPYPTLAIRVIVSILSPKSPVK